MENTTTAGAVEGLAVTQQAREAVAKQVEEAFYDECEYAQELRQGLHDSDPNLQHFARFERDIRASQAHSIPEDMLAALRSASWLLADISPDGLVKKQIDEVIARAALTPSPCPGDVGTSPLLALVAGYADYKAISDDRWEQGKAAGYRELGEMVAAALTPSGDAS